MNLCKNYIVDSPCKLIIISMIIMFMPNDKKKDSVQAEWYNLFIELKKQDKLATIIGISIIIIISIGIVYIGTWKAKYASQFYEVKFKINFLEGVQPGIKIRYQGGVTVGEVLNIESDNREHFLNAKIKKDFSVIKYGTRITLKEQGSFGSSYLDISTIPYYFDKAAYQPGDIIPVAEIIPFQETLNNLSKMLESEPNRDSILVTRVKEIKNMINQVAQNKYLLPDQLRSSVRNSIGDIKKVLSKIQEVNKGLFKSVENMNRSLNTTAENLRNELPKLHKTISKLYLYINYNPKQSDESQYMHDEQMYYSILFKMKLINNLIHDYKESPYKIIFESGL